MAYCENCGTNLDHNPNFCPNCGAQLNSTASQQAGSQQQTDNQQWSKTAKTVGTVAGVAVGASLLGSLLHRRRRPPMHHHGGFMGGHRGHGGPMGGHRGHGGPMGGGPMGGPGGPR